jgi:hypothetical protein
LTGPTGPAGAQGPAGPTGAAGAQGLTGPTGPAGAQGPAGPTGDTGPAGPSGAKGDTGANGATGATGDPGPQGPAGTTGQSGTTVHTTAQTLVSSNTWSDLGLTATVTTGDSVLFVSTSGGIVNNGSSSTSYVNVVVRVKVDGNVVETRSYEQSLSTGTTSTNWSFSVTTNVTPGSHTVTVDAQRAFGNAQALLGGTDSSRGTLSVLVLNH